jgi:metal-responsive CopG/Arc/MetJ family transcriptional regulator
MEEIMKTAKVISISLSPEMQNEINEISKLERRSISEIFREAFRQYAALRSVQDVRKQLKRSPKAKRLKQEDISSMISAKR